MMQQRYRIAIVQFNSFEPHLQRLGDAGLLILVAGHQRLIGSSAELSHRCPVYRWQMTPVLIIKTIFTEGRQYVV